MRASIQTVAPDYSLDRMLKDYVNKFYIPAGYLGTIVRGRLCRCPRTERVGAGGRAGWPQVGVTASGPERREMTVAQPLHVRDRPARPAGTG